MHSFTARRVAGSGRASTQGIPTLNFELSDIPASMEEGIYACRVSGLPGVMHYGSRPTHELPDACEVHILSGESVQDSGPAAIEIIERIRDIADFETQEQLIAAIRSDIEKARAILKMHTERA